MYSNSSLPVRPYTIIVFILYEGIIFTQVRLYKEFEKGDVQTLNSILYYDVTTATVVTLTHLCTNYKYDKYYIGIN